jgi:L-iditol 2-dehydrogenase
MKAVVFERVGEMAIRDVGTPSPGPEEVLMSVEAAGICGTDKHIFSGKYTAKYPLIPGHEYAGRIVAVGEDVTGLKVGDLISVDPNITCGRCPYCQRGKTHLCLNLEALGVTRAGGFAEYSLVPAQQAYLLPDTVSAEEGALIEPLACAIHGLHMGRVAAGDTVVILGGGTMGGLLMQLARNAGAAQVLVAEPIAGRRKKLAELGADVVMNPLTDDVLATIHTLDPEGADVVYEAAGRPDTAQQAIGLARRGGTVVFFGCVEPEHDIKVNPAMMNDRELTICGSFNNPFTHRAAVDLVSTGRIKVEPFVSRRFALDEFPEAFDYFGAPDSYKLMIIPGSG